MKTAVAILACLLGMSLALTPRPNSNGKVLAAKEKAQKAAKKQLHASPLGQHKKTPLGHSDRIRLSARHTPKEAAEESGIIAFHKDGKCGAKVPKKSHKLGKKITALLAEPELPESTAHPGAGKGDVTPYDIVYKDGYFSVACVQDHVRIYKDLHSAQGSHRYKEDASDVSIIWYHENTEKEDMEAMTPKVCYEFCRTVPDMGYFGLYAGTDCYCAPYYRSGEGGEGDSCDMVCEGDQTKFCGGQSKSEIYEMHLCADTMDELNAAKEAGEAVSEAMTTCTSDIDAEGMQKAADTLRDTAAKKFGDAFAGDLGQSASVFAGELTHLVEDCEKMETEMGDMMSDWDTHSGFEVGRMSQVEAEDFLIELKKSIEEGEALAKVSADAKDAAHPPVNETRTASAFEQYLTVMTLVDKEKAETKASCSGTATRKPISGLTKEECAFACDEVMFPTKERCMAFQYFEDAEGGKLCFLFSEVQNVNYYQCEEGGKFLQKESGKAHRAADDLQCYMKFSMSTGWSAAGTAELTGCFAT